MRVHKDIVYPIFLECSMFAIDLFWENIFYDLAYGNTPYGTYISKDSLCCSYNDKEFSYKIERKDPEQMYNEIYNLLTKKLGILSLREKAKKRIDFHKIEEQIRESRKNWNSIKKKNVKDLLIEKYVISMKNKHKLSIKQTRYLLSIIFISMVFKVITSKDINYSDGKINSIAGIDFEKKKVILERNVYKIDISFAPQIMIDKKLMSDNWGKYLEKLRKLEL
jgi:hypothetical protein